MSSDRIAQAAQLEHIYPSTHRVTSNDECRLTIDILPDDVLLLIFHFDRVIYLEELHLDILHRPRIISRWWRWLVHVCRRWRSVVFAWPNFLDLKLVCGPTSHVGVWPPLPIVIQADYPDRMGDYDFDVAIMHHKRVCEIHLNLTDPDLQQLASAMPKAFPALIHLVLTCASDGYEEYIRHISPMMLPPVNRAQALPDDFLGGFAPRLQTLTLGFIPFPALPDLLLSATNLVRLVLEDIPPSGYIPPEAILAGLAVLANLEIFIIKFEPDFDWGTPYLLSPTHSVLPALTHFEFRGNESYLDVLVALIDAPLLDTIIIWTTFDAVHSVQAPQLAQFMERTTRFEALNETHLEIFDDYFRVKFPQPTPTIAKKFTLRILCRGSSWQWENTAASIAESFASIIPSIYMVEDLYISSDRILFTREAEYKNSAEWLEIFRLFTTLKNLYLSKEFVQRSIPTLLELVGERVADVLPALENIFLEELQPSGPIQVAIAPFVAARQLSGHPVAISHWDGI